jgi:hypothetical protein
MLFFVGFFRFCQWHSVISAERLVLSGAFLIFDQTSVVCFLDKTDISAEINESL